VYKCLVSYVFLLVQSSGSTMENHILHLQLGLVMTDFLPVKEEGRDHQVNGLSPCRLWHSNARRDDMRI